MIQKLKSLVKKVRQRYIFDPFGERLKSIEQRIQQLGTIGLPAEEKRFIFQHFPKVAGTSIMETLLTANSWEDEVIMLPHEWLQDVSIDKFKDLYNYKFIGGHLTSYMINRMSFPNKRVFCFFREPKERVLSNYYFIKNHKWKSIIAQAGIIDFREIKGNTLLEYLKNTHSHVHTCDNIYVKMLANIPYSRPQVYSEEIKYACEALEKMDFIGFQESLEDDIRLLSKRFDLKNPKEIYRTNITGENHNRDSNTFEKQLPKKEEMTSKIKKALDRATKYDYIIYNKAKEIRARRGY